MRLIKQMIIKIMSEHDANRLNKRFEPYNYYQAIQLCTQINQTQLNYQEINNLYQRLQKRMAENDQERIKILINQLKKEMNQDQTEYQTFLLLTQDINEEDDTKTDAWTKNSIGILSYQTE